MKWLIGLGLLMTVGMAVWSALSWGAGTPAIGEDAPDFRLPDQTGTPRTLKDYAGKWVVLYFYPKDDTPGCTQQACAFRNDFRKLTDLGAQVLGMSVDDSASHAAFARKYHLPFPLLADSGGAVAQRYGALRNLGIVKFAKRYTFLIDPQGKIAQVYLSVDTARHSQEIIVDLQAHLSRSYP